MLFTLRSVTEQGRRQWVRELWQEQPGLHRGYIVDVVTAVAIATALIAGGYQRTAAAAWGTLNNSGGPVLWGAVFAAVAAVLLIATLISGRAMMCALWLAAILYALMGWWFLQNALPHESTVSFVATIMQFRAAATHVFRGEAYRAGPDSRDTT